MNMKEQVEFDIRAFFEQINNQSSGDQRETLRLLLEKYTHLSKADYLMDKTDLDSIIGNAKQLMATKTLPVFLGKAKRRVMEHEQANLCVIESTISHLNKNNCLLKLPKFEYKEDTF